MLRTLLHTQRRQFRVDLEASRWRPAFRCGFWRNLHQVGLATTGEQQLQYFRCGRSRDSRALADELHFGAEWTCRSRVAAAPYRAQSWWFSRLPDELSARNE